MSNTAAPVAAVRRMLHTLGVCVHHAGYRQLCVGLPRFASAPEQSLSKELYPYIAAQYPGITARDVEASIRRAIRCAWERREPEVWERYFPRLPGPPTNRRFLATLAEYLD